MYWIGNYLCFFYEELKKYNTKIIGNLSELVYKSPIWYSCGMWDFGWERFLHVHYHDMVGKVPAFQPSGQDSVPGKVRDFNLYPGIGCVSFVFCPVLSQEGPTLWWLQIQGGNPCNRVHSMAPHTNIWPMDIYNASPWGCLLYIEGRVNTRKRKKDFYIINDIIKDKVPERKYMFNLFLMSLSLSPLLLSIHIII